MSLEGISFFDGVEYGQIDTLGDAADVAIRDAVARMSRAQDVEGLYWDSDIPVAEILEAYDVPSIQKLLEIVGPTFLEGVACRRCGGAVSVTSRSAAKAARDYPSWALCRSCADLHRQEQLEARERQQQEFRRQDEERAARIEALRTMPYRQYLQTPEWQATRSAALKRASFRCQTCCGGGKLDVHHRTYVRRGSEWARDLVVLCSNCHRLFHENGRLADGGRADE